MTSTLPRKYVERTGRNENTSLKSNSDGQMVFDRGEWITHAKCRTGDPDALFVRGAEQRKAAVVCRHCPVQLECRADALDNKVEFGVWGGLTERQRRALLRKNPHITDWTAYLSNGGALEGI